MINLILPNCTKKKSKFKPGRDKLSKKKPNEKNRTYAKKTELMPKNRTFKKIEYCQLKLFPVLKKFFFQQNKNEVLFSTTLRNE